MPWVPCKNSVEGCTHDIFATLLFKSKGEHL